jgi:hypothetical protein
MIALVAALTGTAAALPTSARARCAERDRNNASGYINPAARCPVLSRGVAPSDEMGVSLKRGDLIAWPVVLWTRMGAAVRTKSGAVG